jgi:putrescine transport system substrate-binding protein
MDCTSHLLVASFEGRPQALRYWGETIVNVLRQVLTAVVFGALATACSKRQDTPTSAPSSAAPAAEEKVLNLFIWNDYLAEDTISNFEKETGIKVTVSNYGSNEELQAKLAPGHSGYDVVVPGASFLERQIQSGLYLTLDKSQLPNLKNMDPDIQRRLAALDQGNEHAVLHMWGTAGLGYNVDKLKAALPNAPLGSWDLIFKSDVVKNFQTCGITVLDSAAEMYAMTLIALGKDANSQKPEDIAAATDALMRLRPFVRYVDTQRMISDLANGEVCLAVGYNGDILQAASRAEENKTGQKIAYSIPKEGTIMWLDNYAIPKDAPHPVNAHVFINYMLRPEVIAAVSNFVHYANGNLAARPFVNKDVLDDPSVYPPPDVMAKLVPDLGDSEESTRLMTRGWQKFTTGH